MKLRHIKRTTQRRTARASWPRWLARRLGLLWHDELVHVIRWSCEMPNRIAKLIADTAPEPLNQEAIDDLTRKLQAEFPGSSATPDGA